MALTVTPGSVAKGSPWHLGVYEYPVPSPITITITLSTDTVQQCGPCYTVRGHSSDCHYFIWNCESWYKNKASGTFTFLAKLLTLLFIKSEAFMLRKPIVCSLSIKTPKFSLCSFIYTRCVHIRSAMRLLVTYKPCRVYFECLNIQLQMMLQDLRLKTHPVLFIMKLLRTDDFTELCLYGGT